jgi:hypothetical protein
MIETARLPARDRSDLFAEAADHLRIQPVVAEKDFWVCLVLQVLFRQHSLQSHLVFKGGTSLSTAYGLIQRFSEDIDLILDWQLLGFGRQEPLQDFSSNTRRDKFNKEANRLAGVLIGERLAPELDFLLRPIVDGLSARVDPADPMVINVLYPQAFPASYIRPEVRLEVGPLAAWVPSAVQTIQPYVADVSPNSADKLSCEVLTILAERTF